MANVQEWGEDMTESMIHGLAHRWCDTLEEDLSLLQ